MRQYGEEESYGLSGLNRSFPTFIRDFRMTAMFSFKSIMPLPFLGSVVAGHQNILLLLLMLLSRFTLFKAPSCISKGGQRPQK
jgi:hypothetical protein